MPLSHGGALKLTTSLYFTPSGVSIHEKGILPDVVIDGPDAVPGDLDASAPIALGKRDPEVRVALEELKTHARLARERVALATVQ
jgi:carboxyl-terminal processing protease